jgi:phosphate-selective porin OprO/OprP
MKMDWSTARVAMVAIGVVMLPVAPSIARADEDVATLLKRLDAHERRIRVLEERLQVGPQNSTVAACTNPTAPTSSVAPSQPALVATPIERPSVKIGPDGIGLKANDGSTQIRFGGEFTFDGRFFTDDLTPDGSRSTWLIRRARPIIDGTFGNIFDYRFMPDFAGGKTIVQDAYVAARLRPWAVLTAGKFKEPFGLERLQFSANNRFLELGLPSDLVPNRDLGVQLSGAVLDGRARYQVGWFNGALDGVSSDANTPPDVDNNDAKDVAARVLTQPFLTSDILALRGFSVGAAISYDDQTGKSTASLLPTYSSENERPFFSYDAARTAADGSAVAGPTIASGRRLRWSPQATYYFRSLGVLGEYVGERQDVSRTFNSATNAGVRTAHLDHDAWQVYVTYLVTGEDATYTRVVPHQPFAVGAPGWGAFELAVRYGELRLDPQTFAIRGGSAFDTWFANPATQARELKAWTLGLNWYLTENVTWMLDYNVTEFVGGAGTAAAPEDRSDEKALLMRFQIAY